MLGIFASGKLDGRGAALREPVAGIGYVDMVVTFSSGLLHVLELKMLKGRDLPGPAQLGTYMVHKKRKEGWLVLFDARKPKLKTPIQPTLKSNAGTIRIIAIDINPVPPHQLPSP